MQHLEDKIDVAFQYPKLDTASLSIQVYTDASFANNHGHSSQPGHMIFLSEKHGNFQPLF